MERDALLSAIAEHVTVRGEYLEKLNNALAVIAQKDEALDKLAKLGNGDRYGNSIGNDIAIQALALTPNNVRLVEVGKVSEVGGSLFASQYSPNKGVKVGDKLYTIDKEARLCEADALLAEMKGPQ